MIIFQQFLFLILTYFIAAIPFGLILAKVFANTDIRQLGSKNIGATNVARIVGKKLGLVTLLLDGFKGAIMIILARFTFSESSDIHLFLVLVGAVAVVAHIYPIYLNYKGGKGVATAIAVLLALDPIIGFLSICFWITVFCIFRISAIASLIAILSSALLSSFYDAPGSQVVFCWLLLLLITYRHKENISRMLTGEEKKL